MPKQVLKVNDILLNASNVNFNLWPVEKVDTIRYEVDSYIKDRLDKKIPITISGFAKFLGCNRSQLYRLANQYQTVKEAIETIKTYLDDDILTNSLMGNYNPAMSQFILRNTLASQYNKDNQKAQQQTNIQINCNIPNRDIDPDKVTIDNDSIKVHIQSKLDNLKDSFKK